MSFIFTIFSISHLSTEYLPMTGCSRGIGALPHALDTFIPTYTDGIIPTIRTFHLSWPGAFSGFSSGLEVPSIDEPGSSSQPVMDSQLPHLLDNKTTLQPLLLLGVALSHPPQDWASVTALCSNMPFNTGLTYATSLSNFPASSYLLNKLFASKLYLRACSWGNPPWEPAPMS